jgi:uncharacterized protein
MMKLASSFAVPAAPDKVVALFLDPATMRACIPGCAELVQTDDRHYQGSLVNEVAHVRFKAGFIAEITSVSSSAGTGRPAVVTGVLRGSDRRLGSTIQMDATLTVSPRDGDSAEVGYEIDLAVRGKLGRLGESVIRRRTAEVERQFAAALSAVCAGRPVPQRNEPEPQRAASETGAEIPQRVENPPRTATPAGPARQDRLVLGLVAATALLAGVLIGERLGGRR